MIIGTISSGDSGCDDTLHCAARHATIATAALLLPPVPAGCPGAGPPRPRSPCASRTPKPNWRAPCSDPRGHYDPRATTRAAHRLAASLTQPLPGNPPAETQVSRHRRRPCTRKDHPS